MGAKNWTVKNTSIWEMDKERKKTKELPDEKKSVMFLWMKMERMF